MRPLYCTQCNGKPPVLRMEMLEVSSGSAALRSPSRPPPFTNTESPTTSSLAPLHPSCHQGQGVAAPETLLQKFYCIKVSLTLKKKKKKKRGKKKREKKSNFYSSKLFLKHLNFKLGIYKWAIKV